MRDDGRGAKFKSTEGLRLGEQDWKGTRKWSRPEFIQENREKGKCGGTLEEGCGEREKNESYFGQIEQKGKRDQIGIWLQEKTCRKKAKANYVREHNKKELGIEAE